MNKIVLVEDDELFVKMYQKKFQKEGFELLTALDGEEGLKLIQQTKPELVILDLMMPKMGGVELLRKIRTDQDLKDLPVVVMTNLNSSSAEVKEAIGLGVKETVLKTDVTPAEIVEVAKKYLPK